MRERLRRGITVSASYFMNIVRVGPSGQIETLDEYYSDDDMVPEIGLAFWEWDESPAGLDWRWSIGFDPVAEAEMSGEHLDPGERKALMEKQPGFDDTYDPEQVIRAIEYIAQAIRRGTDEPVLTTWRVATDSPDYDADAFSESVADEMAALLDVCKRAQAQSARLLSGYAP